MAECNLIFGWLWVLVGFMGGAIIGLFFYDSQWLGGYSAWPRRMVRLGHISFLGTGLLNLAFVFSVDHWNLAAAPRLASYLLIVGAVTMPSVCFLSAWHDAWRHAFFIPVGALIVAAGQLLVMGLL